MWRQVIGLLASSLIFIGCSTTEERINYRHALQDMQYLPVNDQAQCAALQQCRYIKDMICFTKNSLRKQKRCERDFRKSTAEAGGNTFLVQVAESNRRLRTYTAIGQAYDCKLQTNTNPQPGHVPQHHFKVRVISDIALHNCGVPQSCKPVKAINCRSRRGNPVRRCDTYVRNHTIRAGGNTFITQEKGFYANNRGYILNGMAYNCAVSL